MKIDQRPNFKINKVVCFKDNINFKNFIKIKTL